MKNFVSHLPPPKGAGGLQIMGLVLALTLAFGGRTRHSPVFMKVLELMNPKVVTVGLKTPLREVLKLMLRYHLNNVLVVDAGERLEGIVTYSDLSRKLLPTQRELMEHEEYLANPQSMEDRFRDIVNVPVDEVMTRNVISVPPDLEALQAGATMTARRIKELPVVQNGKVIGTFSHTDLGWGLMMQYADCMKG